MKRTLILSGAVALLLSTSGSVFADKITRKSETKLTQGTITTATRDLVTIKDSIGKSSQVPTNDIVGIDWELSEPADMPLGRGAEKNGKYDAALDYYAKCLKDSKAKGNVLGDIEFLIARTHARRGLTEDASKLDEAQKKLDVFVKARVDHYRHYEAVTLLGQVLLAKKDYEGADAAFTKLIGAPWPEYKLWAKNASAKIAVVKNDLAGAMTKFEDVASNKGESAPEIYRRNEAIVGKASVLVAQKNYEEALKVIATAIEALSSDDSEPMAEAFILRGDCLQAQGKPKEAILAYLAVHVLFEKERELHARALFHLAALWPKFDQPDRGDQAKKTLVDHYPTSEWAKKLQ